MIAPRGLQYLPERQYKFLIETSYYGKVYSQTILVNMTYVPLATVKCRMENACLQQGYFKRFNPDKSLIVDGFCTEQCLLTTSVSYHFGVYMNMGTLSAPNWVLYVDSQGLLEGK